MRPLPPPAAFAAAAAVLAATGLVCAVHAPAVAAPRGAPAASVLVVADVTEGAQQMMPGQLWRKLAAEYVGANAVTAEDGTALPDDAHCRSAHALYAVLATFERATRLPGLAQDPDRAYGIARFTVRNCVTGTVLPTKTVQVESDPLSEAGRAALEPNGERIWSRAVRTTLAREPLVLPALARTATVAPATAVVSTATVAPTAVARIARVGTGVVFIESAGGFSVNQILRDFADASGKPYAAPIELIVLEVRGKQIQAFVTGNGTPRVGDYVEAAPAAPK